MSDLVKRFPGYAFSKDYAALFELMKESNVICVCEVPVEVKAKLPFQEVAATVHEKHWKHGERFIVNARGLYYVDASSAEDFVTGCQRVNLQYLPPNGTHISAPE